MEESRIPAPTASSRDAFEKARALLEKLASDFERLSFDFDSFLEFSRLLLSRPDFSDAQLNRLRSLLDDIEKRMRSGPEDPRSAPDEIYSRFQESLDKFEPARE